MSGEPFFGALLRLVKKVWEQVEPHVVEAVADDIVRWMNSPTPNAA